MYIKLQSNESTVSKATPPLPKLMLLIWKGPHESSTLFAAFILSHPFAAKLYCSSSPCQNGGVCEEKENNYQCQCKDGYLGYNCEGNRNRNNVHIYINELPASLYL